VLIGGQNPADRYAIGQLISVVGRNHQKEVFVGRLFLHPQTDGEGKKIRR
jgi:hypothetical protein